MNNSTMLQVLNATQNTVADLLKELAAERKELSKKEATLNQAVDVELQKEFWATYASQLIGFLGKTFRDSVNQKILEKPG